MFVGLWPVAWAGRLPNSVLETPSQTTQQPCPHRILVTFLSFPCMCAKKVVSGDTHTHTHIQTHKNRNDKFQRTANEEYLLRPPSKLDLANQLEPRSSTLCLALPAILEVFTSNCETLITLTNPQQTHVFLSDGKLNRSKYWPYPCGMFIAGSLPSSAASLLRPGLPTAWFA